MSYLTGQAAAAAQDNYFTSFISSPVSPVVFALLFMGVTAFIVYNGVQDGIERVSRYMMPVLLVLVVVIAGYSLTLRHTDASGQMRTGMEGFVYYLTPHLEGLTVSRFLPDPAGRHEPAVLLAQRFHGHHDHLWFLRQTGC